MSDYTDYLEDVFAGFGPITVRRMPSEQWDDFTLSVTKAWDGLGYAIRPDMNGEFGEGYSPLPLSNDGGARRSTAVGYLTDEVRRRPNLTILSRAQARRVIFEGRRAVGADERGDGAERTCLGEQFERRAGGRALCLLCEDPDVHVDAFLR